MGVPICQRDFCVAHMDFDSYENITFTGDIQCCSNDFVLLTPISNSSKEISSEEHWYALRRCFRCKAFYTEAENQDPNNKCNYHPGTYIEPRTITSLSMGWSCCRSKTHSSYLNPNAIGCKQQDSHVEDHFFTQTMKLFPFDPDANRDEQLKKILNEEMYRKEIEKNTKVPSVIPGIDELI